MTVPDPSEARASREVTRGGQAAIAGGTIVGVDFARFLAAMSVVLYHYAFFSWHEPVGATGVRAAIGVPVSYPALMAFSWWGWVGVEIFFVISGLVICRSAEHRSPTAFLRSRILRIAPALWFFATLSFGVTLLYSSAAIDSLLPMYLRSVVLFPKGPWIDGVYWTLTVEAVFYGLTCLLILSGWISRLQSVALAASVLVLGFYLTVIAARVWPELGFSGPVRAVADAYVSRLLLLTTGAYFLVGANLYLLSRDGFSVSVATALVASLVAGAVGLWFSGEHSIAVQIHGRSPATPVLIWLTVVAAISASLRPTRGGRGSGRMQGIARQLGLASYPLYLFHNIAGAFLFGLLLAAGIGAYPALIFAIGLCLVVSVGFALWLEPSLRRGLAERVDLLRSSLAIPVGRARRWRARVGSPW